MTSHILVEKCFQSTLYLIEDRSRRSVEEHVPLSKRFDRDICRDARILVDNLIDRQTVGEVLEQDRDGHSRTGEAGCPPKPPGIRHDDYGLDGIGRYLVNWVVHVPVWVATLKFSSRAAGSLH